MEDPPAHHRRSIRLPGYDYTQAGSYFITIVTHHRECIFGEVMAGEMRLSRLGEIAEEEWFRTPVLRPYVVVHPEGFVVMPNHVHGILWIVELDDDPGRGAASLRPYSGEILKPTNVIPGSLGAIIRGYKSAVTNRINKLRYTPGTHIWQRNYYEHILRNSADLEAIASYIRANPVAWTHDREYPL